MDFKEFMDEMLALYPNSFKDTVINGKEVTNRVAKLVKAYYTALKAYNIDYNQLYNEVISENTSNFLPDIATVKNLAVQKCLIRSENKFKKKSYKAVRIYNPILKCITDNDIWDYSVDNEVIEKSYKKIFSENPDLRIEKIEVVSY